MVSETQWGLLKQNLRVMQIIIVAMAASVFIFIGMLPFLKGQQVGVPLPFGLSFTEVGLALAGLAVVAWLIVPGLFASSIRQAIADGKQLADRSTNAGPGNSAATGLGDLRPLVNMYQTRLIVGASFLEGAAFFNGIAYLFEVRPLALATAALLALLILASIPTNARLRRWLESDLATIKQLRAMGSQHGR
jgi:hypothetical protein